MKLWLISQNVNNDYDTYSDAVVAAETRSEARNIHPRYPEYRWDSSGCWYGIRADESRWSPCDTWARPDQVTAELLGTAKPGTKAGVICKSYHAG
jgi:hypothetical protein